MCRGRERGWFSPATLLLSLYFNPIFLPCFQPPLSDAIATHAPSCENTKHDAPYGVINKAQKKKRSPCSVFFLICSPSLAPQTSLPPPPFTHPSPWRWPPPPRSSAPRWRRRRTTARSPAPAACARRCGGGVAWPPACLLSANLGRCPRHLVSCSHTVAPGTREAGEGVVCGAGVLGVACPIERGMGHQTKNTLPPPGHRL